MNGCRDQLFLHRTSFVPHPLYRCGQLHQICFPQCSVITLLDIRTFNTLCTWSFHRLYSCGCGHAARMHALLLTFAAVVLNHIRLHTRGRGGGLYITLLICSVSSLSHQSVLIGLAGTKSSILMDGFTSTVVVPKSTISSDGFTITVVLCECNQIIHASSCVRVIELMPIVKHTFELVRFVH